MKYRFKNPELEKVVFTLFDKDSAMATIAEQMQDRSINIVLENARYTTSGTNLNKDVFYIEDLSGAIAFPKEEIEEYED